VVFSPNGQQVLSGGDDGFLILWDLASGEPIRSMVAGYTVQVAFARNGQYALSNGERVSVWDLSTGEEIRRYWGMDGVGVLALSSDSNSFFGTGPDNRAHQWRIDWGQDLLDWTRANRYIRDLTCEERAQYRLEPACPPL
jgi:WD40 repeat protein